MVHEPASSMRIHELSTLDAKSANPAGTASALLILPSSSVRCLFSLECDRGGGAGVMKSCKDFEDFHGKFPKISY